MLVGFFSLPGEIRNRIYEELLVVSLPLEMVMDANETHFLHVIIPPTYSGLLRRPELCAAIVLVNKQTYHEANSVLCSMNQLIIDEMYKSATGILASFLPHIGSQNAGFLRHISIEFPTIRRNINGIWLSDRSARDLKLIRENCTSLVTLETTVDSTNEVELSIVSFKNPRAAGDALALVDLHFRAISSLKDVIVNVYDNPPNFVVRNKIRGYGWAIKVTGGERENWRLFLAR